MLILSGLNSFSQDCKVRVDSLKGKYNGGCKNGYADGNGTALGRDSYTGDFKNGYPHGYGKYTWQNGNSYTGYWQKGVENGMGTLHMMKSNDTAFADISGVWKNGKYSGKFEKPYAVQAITNRVNSVTVNRGKVPEDVVIIVKSVTGGALTIAQITIPKPELTDIQTREGRYATKIDELNYNQIANRYTLKGVVFPLYLTLYFGSERVDIDLMEKSNWTINVVLDK